MTTTATDPVAPAATAADPFPGKAVVLYDGDCALCRRSVAIVRKLDWLGRFAYHSARDADHLPPSAVPLDPVRMLEEMHVLTADRKRVYVGFRAVRWLLWRLPATVLVAPLMYVPGVPYLGNRAYLWVAKNRLNLVPCAGGACQVPLKKKPAK